MVTLQEILIAALFGAFGGLVGSAIVLIVPILIHHYCQSNKKKTP